MKVNDCDYVVTINCKKTYKKVGNEIKKVPLEKEDGEIINFMGLDTECGSFSTGFACFHSSLASAYKFDSVQSAENKFYEWLEELKHTSSKGDYDFSTVKVQKIVLEECKELKS